MLMNVACMMNDVCMYGFLSVIEDTSVELNIVTITTAITQWNTLGNEVESK